MVTVPVPARCEDRLSLSPRADADEVFDSHRSSASSAGQVEQREQERSPPRAESGEVSVKCEPVEVRQCSGVQDQEMAQDQARSDSDKEVDELWRGLLSFQPPRSASKFLIVADSIYKGLPELPSTEICSIGGVTAGCIEMLIAKNLMFLNNYPCVVFAVGGNDLAQRVKVQDVLGSFENILSCVYDMNCDVSPVIASILPRPREDAELSEVFVEANAGIRLLCKKYRAIYLKINHKFIKHKFPAAEYFSEDGVHLSSVGVTLLAGLLRRFVTEIKLPFVTYEEDAQWARRFVCW